MVTALDRLGLDTLGLLELINRLATMGVDLKVLDMPVVRPRRCPRRAAGRSGHRRSGGHRAGQHQPADEAGAGTGPG